MRLASPGHDFGEDLVFIDNILFSGRLLSPYKFNIRCPLAALAKFTFSTE
jgi:hypothetical protein